MTQDAASDGTGHFENSLVLGSKRTMVFGCTFDSLYQTMLSRSRRFWYGREFGPPGDGRFIELTGFRIQAAKKAASVVRVIDAVSSGAIVKRRGRACGFGMVYSVISKVSGLMLASFSGALKSQKNGTPFELIRIP